MRKNGWIGQVVLLAALAACEASDGDDGTDTDTDVETDTDTDVETDTEDDTDTDLAGDTDDTDLPAPSYATDVEPILHASCTPCHVDGGNSGLLTLDDGYDNLVGTASTQAPALDRVEPGDPDQSYLWHKLQGTQADVGGSGNQMPAVGSLTQAELDTIEAWIEGGALP